MGLNGDKAGGAGRNVTGQDMAGRGGWDRTWQNGTSLDRARREERRRQDGTWPYKRRAGQGEERGKMGQHRTSSGIRRPPSSMVLLL